MVTSGAGGVPLSWRPFMRESELARFCLATGLHALARANHMQTGRFSEAFFNLSVGLERLLKLVYVIDYALRNSGSFPSNDTLRNRFRHDLVELYGEARQIKTRLAEEGTTFEWAIPDAVLAERIVLVLGEFAKATRYYNLQTILGSPNPGRDPIAAWADEVGRYLMSEYPAHLRKRDEDWAEVAEAFLGEHSLVRQQTESGDAIGSVSRSILHGRRGEWIQARAVLHCATIVREFAEVLWALSDAARPGEILTLPALHEYFTVYYNDDKYLKNRRTFLE